MTANWRKTFRRRRVRKQPQLADASDLTVSIHFPRSGRKCGSKHSWITVNAVSSDLIAVKSIVQTRERLETGFRLSSKN